MPRVTIGPRRDLDKPLIEVDSRSSTWRRLLGWTFRGYIAFVALIGLLAVISGIVFLFRL